MRLVLIMVGLVLAQDLPQVVLIPDEGAAPCRPPRCSPRTTSGYRSAEGGRTPGPNKALAIPVYMNGPSPYQITLYYATTPNTYLAADAIGLSGSGQGHPNMQPYLALNFIATVVAKRAFTCNS